MKFDDANDMLLESFGKHKNLITNVSKKLREKSTKEFALSLHFFSAKAYDYVRKQFNTILPHSRTLGKWYSHVNAEPGFTEEAIETRH
ncbi:THAP domain-containing protein 1 B-like [Aphis craccivora]|uniref:THAP domain-containing protein 1 B-like n=1 Tax=Aphis craccivora TaxID=307492 RepID=A0A6G0Y834_APHCR|nr:THAP domain-containing protein 1 B-like [Aphis craccivora]